MPAVLGNQSRCHQTTFQEETETDLFGEQAVLCGGICQLITNGLKLYAKLAINRELPILETFHEMKLIVDLMYEAAWHKMRKSISDTAEYGGTSIQAVRRLSRKEATKKAMKEVLLTVIQDGTFVEDWRSLKNKAGGRALLPGSAQTGRPSILGRQLVPNCAI